MVRTLLHSCALLALVLPAAAQSLASGSLRPIPGAVRDAGTLHLPDGTWTRKSSGAALGTDVLYDNTCNPEYFSALSGDTYLDEGRIPGTSSPDNLTSKTGCATSYAVDGFQIGYCTDLASANFLVSFFQNYFPCSSGIGVTPAGAFSLPSLPGAPVGTTLCWTVNVDASFAAFALDAGATNPLFGFSISSPQSSTVQGPIIAGNPAICAGWDGTSWDPMLNLAESGTGMGTLDRFYIEGGPTIPGCYFFGGIPFASFWLELYGTTCAPSGPGQAAFCVAGLGGTAACPCGNDPAAGAGTGCRNSFGIGARLAGAGTASIAGDTVVLTGTQMPVNSPVLYFQGTLRHNAGIGQAFGDGLRCAGGAVVRLGTAINSAAGSSQYPGVGQPSISARGNVAQPGTRTYQAWYRNVAPFCTAAGFNTSNGWEIAWGA